MGKVRDRVMGPGRRELAAAVRSPPFGVGLVLGQDRLQMPLSEDEHPVGDLCPGGTPLAAQLTAARLEQPDRSPGRAPGKSPATRRRCHSPRISRVWISITNSTYTRGSSMVSTCRKSQARMLRAWWPGTAARSAMPAAVPSRGRRRPGSGGWSPPHPVAQADGQGFSKSGLLNQLTSSYGEGFTEAQAEYAVSKVGL